MEAESRKGSKSWRMMSRLNLILSRVFRSTNISSKLVLVLTTTGRKSKKPHSTPLQYEQIEGIYYVASARGDKADWYQNILADAKVEVEVGGQHFPASAQPITDAQQIADFLEIRIRKRPIMIKALMILEGLPPNYTRADLEKISSQKVMVALHNR